MKAYMEPVLLVAAIILGSFLGFFTNFETSLGDTFILAMLFFLFYTISFDKFLKGVQNKKYLVVAWLSNFVVIPLFAYAIASIFVDNSSAVFIGLIMYLVAPCTDWFLGFTKLAKGDIEINSAILPINLLSQIVLLPVYLFLFTTNTIPVPIDTFFDVLINWVLVPFALAQLLRFAIAKSSKGLLERSHSLAEKGMVTSLVLLVFALFNSNINSLIENFSLVPAIFGVIFVFFFVTYYLIEFTAKRFGLSRKEEISLAMTTAARNAPLMLGISLALFPGQTAIHLALIIGMLVEFPHLISITYLLKGDASLTGFVGKLRKSKFFLPKTTVSQLK